MAFLLHISIQVIHSIQSSGDETTTLFSTNPKTSLGQASMQSRQKSHLSVSIVGFIFLLTIPMFDEKNQI